MIKFLLMVFAVILLSSCSGGFGSSTDEEMAAQIPYSSPDAISIAVAGETFEILQAGFLESEVYLESQSEVIEIVGGISMWFKFLQYKVGADKSIEYSLYVTSYQYLDWLFRDNLARILNPMVLDGELESTISLIYFLTSENIKEELHDMGIRIIAANKNISDKASANDAEELRQLFKKFAPFMEMIPGVGGLL